MEIDSRAQEMYLATIPLLYIYSLLVMGQI